MMILFPLWLDDGEIIMPQQFNPRKDYIEKYIEWMLDWR